MGIFTAILWGLFCILINLFLVVGTLSLVIWLILCIKDCIKGENIRIFW